MAQHTPGPWTVETRHYVHAICCQPTRPKEHPEVAFIDVAAGPGLDANPDDLSAGSITAQQRSREELHANARLIAAAPRLRAALERILQSAGYESGECEPALRARGLTVDLAALDEARAALAAA